MELAVEYVGCHCQSINSVTMCMCLLITVVFRPGKAEKELKLVCTHLHYVMLYD